MADQAMPLKLKPERWADLYHLADDACELEPVSGAGGANHYRPFYRKAIDQEIFASSIV